MAISRSAGLLTIQKPELDNDALKNYRPVANIPFLANVIEKVVAGQQQQRFYLKKCKVTILCPANSDNVNLGRTRL